jgi:hypothetical protein
MKSRLVTEHQLLSQTVLSVDADGNPRRTGKEDCDPEVSAPETAVTSVLSSKAVWATLFLEEINTGTWSSRLRSLKNRDSRICS